MPGPKWGEQAHVQALFGDRVRHLTAERRQLPVATFDSGREFRDFFAAYYGPAIATYRNIADDPDRTAELDAALIGLADQALADGEMQWEYLLTVAEVA
ncbi:MAG TPA: hypothetical protein VHO01_01585 [Jatrophihabitans sp.]|nr:hypothetical protein [Jatrophihabitans sp.]